MLKFSAQLVCYASSSSVSLPDYDAKCVLYTCDGVARKDCDDPALPRVQPLNLSRYRLHAAAALAARPPAPPLVVLADTPSGHAETRTAPPATHTFAKGSR